MDSTGKLGTVLSVGNKYDIQDITSNIDHLHPATFKYNSDKSNKSRYGLIVEDVEQYYPHIMLVKWSWF